MYVTLHEATPDDPDESIQLVELKEPAEFVAKLTVPTGDEGFDEVSVTITVQIVVVLTVSELGEQLMLVVIVRKDVAMLNVLMLSA